MKLCITYLFLTSSVYGDMSSPESSSYVWRIRLRGSGLSHCQFAEKRFWNKKCHCNM